MANNLIVYSPAVGNIAVTFGKNAIASRQNNQVARREKTNEEAIKFTKGLVSMVNHLASIDHVLKSNLKNDYAKHRMNIQAAREATIENMAQPTSLNGSPDAVKQPESKVGLLDIAAMGLIFAEAFEPAKKAAETIYDYGKAIYERTSSMARILTTVLTSLNNIAPNIEQYFGGGISDQQIKDAIDPNKVRQEYNNLPWYSQFGVAANDLIRIAANGFTFGYADNIAALMGSGEGSTYEERLKSQQAESQRAQIRAGLAGTATSLATGILGPGKLLKGAKAARGTRAATKAGGSTRASETIIDMKQNPRTGVYEAVSASKPSYGPMAIAAGATVAGGALLGADSTQTTPNAAPATTQTPTKSVSGFIDPVDSYRLTSGYGMRNHPTLGVRKMHSGIDMAAPTGTPVKAVSNGTVIFAGPRGADGNCVIIDHGGGLQTSYSHLSRFACQQGQSVKQGQIIGYVGSTGRSSGPHLHFGVKKNGQKVDPSPYLKGVKGATIPGAGDAWSATEPGMEDPNAAIDSTYAYAVAMAKIGQFATKLKGLTTIDNVAKDSMITQAPDYSTYSRTLSQAALKRTADNIEIRTPVKLTESRVPSPPNLNSQPAGTVTTHSTTTEGGDILYQYFRYFGISSPTTPNSLMQ